MASEEKFEAWEGDMNDAELKHYTEVQLGISQKLLETSTEMQEQIQAKMQFVLYYPKPMDATKNQSKVSISIISKV